MEQLLSKIEATLREEENLLDEQIALSEEINDALIRKSHIDLQKVMARQQTSTMRLEIIHQTQRHLLLQFPPELKSKIGRLKIKKLLAELEASEELAVVASIDQKIKTLKFQNSVNQRLLDKQFSSLSAFRNLSDLVTGKQGVYNRAGAMPEIETGLLEHRG